MKTDNKRILFPRRRLRKLFVIGLAVVMTLGLFTTASAAPPATPGFVFTLQDGGRSVSALSLGNETVGNMLSRISRELGEHDIINLDLDHRLTRGDVVIIQRRTSRVYRTTRPVYYSTVYMHSTALRAGTERVVQYGSNGMSDFTLRQYLIDGEVVEETVLYERVIVPSVERRVESGFRSQPMSPFDFGMEFDENHEPIGYIRVLRNQRATAYVATGNRTSLGYWPVVGHVAVNPNVIPYRSRLFIQTPDGSFIYGYALAVDTGGDLMRGVIDIDLFFPCIDMAWQHGVRRMDVFILPPAD